MDETLSLIFHGCELAKEIESNLPNLANHPNLLSKSCEKVVMVFKSAIQRLDSSNINPSSSHSPPLMVFQDPSASERPVVSEAADATVQEWLSSSYTQAMDLFLQSQFSSASKDPLLFSSSTKKGAMGFKEIGSISELIPGGSSSDHHTKKILELGSKEKGISYGGDTEGSSRSRSGGGGGGADVQMAEGADQSAGKSPVGRRSSRKSKDGVDKRTVRVDAPRIGNTEIPPDDGFTWRKYGQKEILGSMFPRGYFRCTHKNFYGCEAKKQVQRLDEDPNVFEVTYYGQHTCHLSSSAPSSFPAPPPSNVSVLDQPPAPPRPPIPSSTTTSNIIPSWPNSIEMEATSTGESSRSHVFTADDLQLPIYYYKDLIGSRSGGGGSSGSGGAGPSSQPGRDTNKEGDCPVLDLADVMFNSGSSSNSMDSIFPSVPDK